MATRPRSDRWADSERLFECHRDLTFMFSCFESVQRLWQHCSGRPVSPPRTARALGSVPGDRAPGLSDFGRGPSPRPGATRQLQVRHWQTHPQRVQKAPQRDSFRGRALGISEARKLSFAALPQVSRADDCHHFTVTLARGTGWGLPRESPGLWPADLIHILPRRLGLSLGRLSRSRGSASGVRVQRLVSVVT